MSVEGAAEALECPPAISGFRYEHHQGGYMPAQSLEAVAKAMVAPGKGMLHLGNGELATVTTPV